MRTYSSTQAAVADLRAGKVVAYLTDAATLQYFSQARPGHAASAHSLRLQTPRCHAVHGSASFKTPIRYPSAATCWSRLGMPCPQLLLSSATTTISVFVHCLPHLGPPSANLTIAARRRCHAMSPPAATPSAPMLCPSGCRRTRRCSPRSTLRCWRWAFFAGGEMRPRNHATWLLPSS